MQIESILSGNAIQIDFARLESQHPAFQQRTAEQWLSCVEYAEYCQNYSVCIGSTYWCAYTYISWSFWFLWVWFFLTWTRLLAPLLCTDYWCNRQVYRWPRSFVSEAFISYCGDTPLFCRFHIFQTSWGTDGFICHYSVKNWRCFSYSVYNVNS